MQALYACLTRALSSVWEGHCGGWASRAIGSTTAGVVRCRCGSALVAITATFIVRVSVRGSAGAILGVEPQRAIKIPRRGAHRHAARQRRWRMRRRQEVTHQGCARSSDYGSVSQPSTPNAELTDAHHPSVALYTRGTFTGVGVCSLCAAPLPKWTRPRRWQWSG